MRSTSRNAVMSSRLSLTAWFVATGTSLLLAWGYSQRDSGVLTPGFGWGYWLGIAGGLVILATLAYPMRKYMGSLRDWGTVAGWFRVHMLFGIFGPAIVLFHSNFKLGALNSNVALIAMLFVAGSGIIGRYLYGKIHHGLHGHRATLSDMVSRVADMRVTLGADLPQTSPLWSQLTRLEAYARKPSGGFLSALNRSFTLSSAAALARRRCSRDARHFIDEECKRRGFTRRQRRNWRAAARLHLDAYFTTLKRTARLILFERLFSLWHVLHVPIFILMLISGLVHVVAVHFY